MGTKTTCKLAKGFVQSIVKEYTLIMIFLEIKNLDVEQNNNTTSKYIKKIL